MKVGLKYYTIYITAKQVIKIRLAWTCNILTWPHIYQLHPNLVLPLSNLSLPQHPSHPLFMFISVFLSLSLSIYLYISSSLSLSLFPTPIRTHAPIVHTHRETPYYIKILTISVYRIVKNDVPTSFFFPFHLIYTLRSLRLGNISKCRCILSCMSFLP